MLKKHKVIIYLLAGLLVLVVCLQYFLPKPPDLTRNYQGKSKSPFGCYAIYNLLGNVYSEKTSINNQTIYNLNNRLLENGTLVIVNDEINFNSSDIESLYDFLSWGNTVFIAASRFRGAINDSLHLRTFNYFDNFFEPFDSLIKKQGADLHFTASNLRKKSYRYSQVASAAYFQNFDSTRFKVLGYIDKNKACLLKGELNSGVIYLMSMPDVFTNYFVVNHDNREVAYTLLSMIKNKELVWDEYYKTYNVTNYSPIKFILESDALYSAYLLCILAIVLYMIFEGRRRQRAIPVSVKHKNTTLEFVNVISHVFFSSKNHKSIATEKIKYFYETLRKKFGVNTGIINDTFYEEISVLSGIELQKVRQLLVYCASLNKSESITELELLELNRQIENFNKNSLR